MKTTLTTIIEASSLEEAWEVARATDGGNFDELENSGDWNVYDVIEVD